MNTVACIYFEGNDSKVALFQKEKDKLVLLKAESIDTSLAFSEQKVVTANKSNGGNKQKDSYQYNFVSDETTAFNRTFLQKLNEFFIGIDLTKCKFVPMGKLGLPLILLSFMILRSLQFILQVRVIICKQLIHWLE